MDGPQHYREAEELLRRAGYYTAAEAERVVHDLDERTALLAAQVHATLAQAAAASAGHNADEWRDTTSPRR